MSESNKGIYHQFTVLYFPETGNWQISEEEGDGVYDAETYRKLNSEEYAPYGEADWEAMLALANKLAELEKGE